MAATRDGKDDDRFAPPAVNLPKGGGAIRGIGDMFSVNPATGTGKLTIPLPISPGRGASTPALSLAYDSGAGNGAYGLGWTVDYPAITRRTDQGLPRYLDDQSSDVFLISGSEDLVPVLQPDGTPAEIARDGYRVTRYRPRVEGAFARIERWSSTSDRGDVYWRAISRDNVTTLFGTSPASRVSDPTDPARIFAWLACESFDDRGNAAVYEYAPEDSRGVDTGLPSEANREALARTAQRYLKRVKYGNRTSRLVQPELDAMEWLFELVMDYGDHGGERPEILPDRAWPVRPDPFSSARAAFEVRTYRRCHRILMFHRFAELGAAPRLVRSLTLDYDDFAYPDGFDVPDEMAWPGSTRAASVLRSATVTGYALDGTARSLPRLELTYTRPRIADQVVAFDADSCAKLSGGVDGSRQRWVDLDGEGLPGVLVEDDRTWWYKRNLGGGRLGPLELVDRVPLAASPRRARLLDLDGDGQLDLVALEDGRAGFYERQRAGAWSPFRPFASQARVDWDDPNLRLVDLTGDGRADLLITESDELCWHPSLGADGFGARRILHTALNDRQGPRVVFEDGTETVMLADMTGDGLSDLVRIRASQVCYWPNLGYGRFGTCIVMDRAPVLDSADRFDPRRIRLADIDGSGAVDLIYLSDDGARLFFNRAGNGWTTAVTVHALPRLTPGVSVDVVDLKGNGTACLVWSTALPGAPQPMRYLDLLGGEKPNLLVGIDNNLGARAAIGYAASTAFYLADRAAGRPWITSLPFPVQVVERIETFDEVSQNQFVTRYSYHHGCFDGVEREFRGFGMVEQIDTEEIAALADGSTSPSAANVDEASHVPPVVTRTWFHTGVYLDGERVSRYFAGLVDGTDLGEYYREPGVDDQRAAQLLLADTVLPAGLTIGEARDAYRALRGKMLRQEVYARDGSDRAQHPYAVTEQNFTVELVQPRQGNRHAVFFAHPRESLIYHYERVPADPRVEHTVTLAVDAYGNPLELVTVAYGRRTPDPDLAAQDQACQARCHVVHTEDRFTNPIDDADDYRVPLRCESRTYELTGLVPGPGAARFTFAQLEAARTNAFEIAFEQSPDPLVLQKRIVRHTRTLYRRNDLSAPLPLAVIESRAVPYEGYQLAFTPGLVASVFGSRIPPTALADAGFVHDEADEQWWVPSGQVRFAADEVAPDVELNEAVQHFYVPRRFRNALGHTAVVAYDTHDLLLSETRDAVGNRITVGERGPDGSVQVSGHDYRVLKPRLVTDPNGNRRTFAFDALGNTVGIAVMGKRDELPQRGDSLDGFLADLPDAVVAAQLSDPLAAPLAILGRATTRIVYDPLAFQRTREASRPDPSVAYVLTRETHDSDLAPGQQPNTQHSLVYSDGFGREVQTKSRGDGEEAAWIASGWTVFNNKGKPVRRFEPFFTVTHRFERDVRVGVSPTLCYDPLQRVVATLHPDHTWEKSVVGSWREERWDVNDTVLVADPRLDPHVGPQLRRLPVDDLLPTWYAERATGELGVEERAAADATAIHAATPAVVHCDGLGRRFLTIAHNRFTARGAAPTDPPVEERYPTRVELDIAGQPREVKDADRVTMRYDYDLRGTCIHDAAMDAGERWMLTDVTGAMVHAHDGRGFHVRTEYDPLQRPLRTFALGLDDSPTTERLVAVNEYGEGQPEDVRLNLRTRLYRQLDSAGVVANVACDFKGNLATTRRQLARRYDTLPDWSASPPLELEAFETTTSYDALDRIIAISSSDASVYRLAYNPAGRIDRIDVQIRGAQSPTTFISNVDYDARGRCTRIVYGNGATTTCTYDPATLRLTRLVTRRGATTSLQDTTYTYDPVGNVTQIRDAAQQTIYFNNQIVSPDTKYVYDAVYRLAHAEGREHVGQVAQPQTSWDDAYRINLPQPGDGNAMRRYTEDYRYDGVGNLLELAHQAASGNWSRTYRYEAASALEAGKRGDRLTSTTIGGTTEPYQYDPHGNAVAMPHLTVLAWDFRNQLQATARQAVSTGSPETTYYVYDAGGQRVRKVTERANGSRRNERIYLGGLELYREYSADGAEVVFARETLHVADAHRRIALVETRTVGDEPGVPQQRIRYQLGNYLGSIALSLDDAAQVVSYEEYYPHGGTAYQAVRSAIEVNWKRYRYLNMERDAETGFGYHGARYYAPWLGRWISPDPHGVGNDGTNLYAYCRNNPVCLSDPNGFDAQKGQFQWASSKEENDKRYTRLTGTVRRFLIDHGIRRDDIRDYLNKFGDRDILEHYGYVENDSGGDANREDNQNRIIEAINKYEDDYLGHPATAVANPVTPAQERAMQAAQAQVQFYQLWLEGWQYVSNSATSAVSAGVASWFTSDQRKITGAAGAGYAASGVTGALAQVAIGRFAAGGNRSPSRNRRDPQGGGGGGGPRPEDNQPIAVGLSGSAEHKRNLVARFADKVGATTYWDLYPGPLPDESVIVERMVNEFQTRPIAVNLSGFTQVQELGPERGLAAILAEPHKMVTEAEVSHVIASPDFFSRATFYLNGTTVQGLDRATIIRLSRGGN